MSIKLKLLRVQANLTLEALAGAADLTRSYVSKIERGVSSPSIGAALKLAKALRVPVEELFGDPSDADPVSIRRVAEAAANPPPRGEPRVVAGTSPGHQMTAFVLRPSKARGSHHPMSRHKGEEILYVLRGRVSLKLADRTEMLAAGDCAHFNAAVPHKITPVSGEDAEVLIVVAGESIPGK